MPRFTGLLGLICILLAISTRPCQCARLNGLSFEAGVATIGRTLRQSNGLPAYSSPAVGNSTLYNTTTSSRNTSAMGGSPAVGRTASGTAVSPKASRNNTLTPSAKNGTAMSGRNGTYNGTINGTLAVTSVVILLPVNVSFPPNATMPIRNATMAPRTATMAPRTATMAPRSGNTTGGVTAGK